MDDTFNPDWRYTNMTQTEIEDHAKGVFFHYYQIDINGRILFLNFREDRLRRRTTLYSITIEIKKATS